MKQHDDDKKRGWPQIGMGSTAW